MTMTTQAKQALSKTIRALRERLIKDLGGELIRVYRLTTPTEKAELAEAPAERRKRLEAWIEEQARAQAKKKGRSAEDFRLAAVKQAASTLLNRLVVLRLMEAKPDDHTPPMRRLPVLTGVDDSLGYKTFRQLAPELLQDEPQGYDFLLQLVFEELAQDLPGLFGSAGVAELVPIPAATLLHVARELDKRELDSCWTDDMTLGWVYQYWNDPEREALDAKLNAGGKVEPHEIASKTQLFTERYMVDWLLQNTLGPMWLALCHKQGWTPRVHANGTLDRLEARRIEWRAMRDDGRVSLTDLMPLHDDDERRWAYYLPQPPPTPASSAGAPSPASGRGEGHPSVQPEKEEEPKSVREWKILDPAVGSGHFLVVALDLLWALYHEETQHRGLCEHPDWSPQAIAAHILGHNLHGIDLDPRAVQIAAASLWLKAQRLAPGCKPERLNLVAAALNLSNLSPDDSALSSFRETVERETGIPAKLTDDLLQALRGADHLGSLLKVHDAINDAISAHERQLHPLGQGRPTQTSLFGALAPQQTALAFSPVQARKSVLEHLETFLARHTHGDDLGLRLRGEQLAAGVRFVRMLREAQYDLVVANPPYQGTAKMADAKYIEKHYPLGKADLYAAFMLRGLELVRRGGISAMLTMRNWMFIKQYAELRKNLLENQNLKKLGDFDRGAFEEIAAGPGGVSVAVSVWEKKNKTNTSLSIRPSPIGSVAHDLDQKLAATLCHVGRYDFDVNDLKVVPEWPLVYWWDKKSLNLFNKFLLIKEISPASFGLTTGNNSRFVRESSEIQPMKSRDVIFNWAPFILGAKGQEWIDSIYFLIKWDLNGLEIKVKADFQYGTFSKQIRNDSLYFKKGIAFSMIGARFGARVHRSPSIFGNKGSSVFPENLAKTVCAMNSSRARFILESLNPGIGFEVGDVNRLPVFEIPNAEEIFAQVEAAFSIHESHREPSVEFKRPGPSPWRQAQAWAQEAVDREEGAPLPPYLEVLDEPDSRVWVSFALGVALGRFGAKGEGILDPDTSDLSETLPHGILFLDTTLDANDKRDGLGHEAAAGLHAAWGAHGRSIHARRSLREWLAWDFFADFHKSMYENRPIHWPLSSSGKTFVAWVNIHRWDGQTLRVLLADHLHPTLARLEGELVDLRSARDGQDKRAAKGAEQRLDKLRKAKEELEEFIKNVSQLAERGPTQPDAKTPAREQDAPYWPDLDDGVMVNSAALWKVLKPQWKDPEKWYKELAAGQGKKDYDWSHLAMRYWPTRVDAKCQQDPSLAVAHGCFWRYHPARAWAWELRLQDEIGPDFRLEEAPYRPGGRELGDQGDVPHRAQWLTQHRKAALGAVEEEARRRMGRGKKRKRVPEMRILERGFWSESPAEVWEMELRLSETQGWEFFLRAPDEEEGRAAYEEANPKKVVRRAELLSEWAAKATLFPAELGGEDEEEEEEGEGGEDGGDDDSGGDE